MIVIIEKHREDISTLCRENGVKELYVFGSALGSDWDSEKSDIDFLLELDEMPPSRRLDAYFDLLDGLRSLFGKVDLVMIDALKNPYLRKEIMKTREAVFGTES